MKQEEELVTHHKMVECLARKVMQLRKEAVLLHFVLSIIFLVCGQSGEIAPLIVVREHLSGHVVAQMDDTEVLNVQNLKKGRNAT